MVLHRLIYPSNITMTSICRNTCQCFMLKTVDIKCDGTNYQMVYS